MFWLQTDDIERLRQKALSAIRIDGLVPLNLSNHQDQGGALMMVVFEESDGGEKPELFSKLVVRFVLPMLLIEFYESHLDLVTSSEVPVPVD